VERCLACEAVVNKETHRTRALPCSALYRVPIETRNRDSSMSRYQDRVEVHASSAQYRA